MKSNLRKKNLIRPALQLKITLVFMATSASLMALMGYLTVWMLSDESRGAPGEADQLMNQVMPVLVDAFLISMALLIPVTLVVGVLATFLVAGPLHRFEIFLTRIRNGENPADCHIRDGDELQDFCDLLNEVTRPLREERGDEEVEEDSTSEFTTAA